MFAVLFKLFQRFDINGLQATLFNYVFGVVVATIIILTGSELPAYISALSFGPNAWPLIMYASLPAIMFLAGFVAMDQATFRCGVALTTIAARAALVIPLTLSWIILDAEEPNWFYVGLIFIAMLLIVLPNRQQEHPDGIPYRSSSDAVRRIKAMLSLVCVFVFYGSADFFINLSNVRTSELSIKSDVLTAYIFIMATIFCAVYCLFKGIFKLRVTGRAIIGGMLLGLANVGCTYMVILGIKDVGASLFYPVYYIGIVVLATVIGLCFFKEKVKWIQVAGLVLAAVAILLLTVK